jgi:hypothetical protein
LNFGGLHSHLEVRQQLQQQLTAVTAYQFSMILIEVTSRSYVKLPAAAGSGNAGINTI